MLSTHIMQEVEAICKRAIIINHGKIVADDATENLSKHTFNKVIITVEFDKSVDAANLKSIAGVLKVRNVKENIWEVETDNKNDLRPEITKYAASKGLSILTIFKEEEKLEKVFQELTKKNK